MMRIVRAFCRGFCEGRVSLRTCNREDKRMRDHLSESQIDKMLKDTFPASDPPSTY